VEGSSLWKASGEADIPSDPMRRSSALIPVLLLALVLFAGTSLAGRMRAPHNRVAPKIAGAALAGQTISAQRGR